MNKSLVYPDLEILLLISSKNLGATQLWKQTGLYKDKLNEIIKELEKGDLIKRKRDPDHEQRKWIQPTNLGNEVIDLLKTGHEYIKTSLDLIDSMVNKILFLTKEPRDLFWTDEDSIGYEENKNAIKFRMTQLGWVEEDILYYQECINKIIHLIEMCDRNFFYILTFRSIRLNINFSINKEAQNVINNIFNRLMGQKMSKILDRSKNRLRNELGGYYGSLPSISKYYQYEIIKPIQRGGIFNVLYDIMNIFVNPLPFAIKNEIENTLKSYINLIKPLFLSSQKVNFLKEFEQEIKNQDEELQKIHRFTKEDLKNYRMIHDDPTSGFTGKNICDIIKLRIRSMNLFLEIARNQLTGSDLADTPSNT